MSFKTILYVAKGCAGPELQGGWINYLIAVVVPEKKNDKLALYGQLSMLLAIPFLLAVGPLVGLFIGKYLDKWLGTGPYLMYLFIILGFIAAGKETYRLVKKVSK